jgi:ABC-2 type transport system ATP-binding protein
MTTTAARIAAESHAAHGADPSEWVIDLADIAKTYRGRIRALRGIAMRVRRGEIFGLLGPNGAGKSTLVKILMTVTRATRCRGTMLGAPVGHKPTLRRVGYLPEHHRFPDYLTGWQVLDFYGALADVPRRDRRRRAGEWLEIVGLARWKDRRVKGYSKGMRQRLGVAQALINDPDLVLLDEPTDGVDPVGRRDIREIMVRLRERGRTVFLNSHLLSELEMVCDRVAILVQGEVSAQGTIEELTRPDQRYEIEVAPTGPGDAVEAIRRAIEPAADPVRRPTEVRGSVIRVGSTDPEAVQPLIDALRRAGLVIRSVRPFRPSLEDLFMRAVTDPATGQALPPGTPPDTARTTPGTEANRP